MVDHGGGTVFPVIYYDGESETNIGNIRIQPTLIFKPFQFILSQKLGISPNAFSIYLCNNHNSSSDIHRRIPVTNKSNFAVICREMKNCFFLVVLKRSRKSRYRKTKPNGGTGGVSFGEFLKENVMYNLYERVQNLQIQKESFENAMKNLGPGSGLVHLDSPNSFPRIEDTLLMKNKKGVICYECENLRRNCGGITAEFHHCLNDAVVAGFRTRSGPVIRPGN